MKAVVFIDVQKDFVKGGALAYGYPYDDIVPNIVTFARKCRAEGCALFATADTHKKTEPSQAGGEPTGGYLATLEGKRLPVEHCIEGTEGHKIVDGLAKDGDAVLIPHGHVVPKNTFGARNLSAVIGFAFDKDMEEPIDKIVICGFCTSICVVSNALCLRASFPNTPIEVVENLCGDIDEASHKAALAVMRNCQIDVVTENVE